MHTNALAHNRKCVVSQVAQWCDGLLRQPLTWTHWALNGSSRDPWQLLLFKPDRKTFRNTRTIHAHAHTYLTRKHTNGFGRNIKDHIDFTGQSRSSPPWGLWEANESWIIVRWVRFSKGLERSGAVCKQLRTIPHPPAGSVRRSQTSLSGASLWLWRKQRTQTDGTVVTSANKSMKSVVYNEYFWKLHFP